MPAIVRIIRVEDTREFIEQGDRFVPLPGTGRANECARCGRLHEVHAHVELADGGVIVVGTGCMGADDSEATRKAIGSAAGKATRLAAKRAEIASLRARLAAYERARLEVDALTPPAIEGPVGIGWADEYRQGAARVLCPDRTGRAFTDERRAALLSAWRDSEMRARGAPDSPFVLRATLDAVERQFARLAGVG